MAYKAIALPISTRLLQAALPPYVMPLDCAHRDYVDCRVSVSRRPLATIPAVTFHRKHLHHEHETNFSSIFEDILSETDTIMTSLHQYGHGYHLGFIDYALTLFHFNLDRNGRGNHLDSIRRRIGASLGFVYLIQRVITAGMATRTVGGL